MRRNFCLVSGQQHNVASLCDGCLVVAWLEERRWGIENGETMRAYGVGGVRDGVASSARRSHAMTNATRGLGGRPKMHGCNKRVTHGRSRLMMLVGLC
ncbi:type I secretion C-terminal target domain-containing protein [Sesbania bispinosa]|nr:type I secretion C-terminal target domain-containing protein [Sesbania bispinosa]